MSLEICVFPFSSSGAGAGAQQGLSGGALRHGRGQGRVLAKPGDAPIKPASAMPRAHILIDPILLIGHAVIPTGLPCL